MKIRTIITVSLLPVMGLFAGPGAAQIDEQFQTELVNPQAPRLPVPEIEFTEPVLNQPAANAHVGRLWVTPVLIQHSGGGATSGAGVTGARVSVRPANPGDESGKTDREILQEQLGGQQLGASASSAAQLATQQNSGDNTRIQSIDDATKLQSHEDRTEQRQTARHRHDRTGQCAWR